jgi:hypothetical protein
MSTDNIVVDLSNNVVSDLSNNVVSDLSNNVVSTLSNLVFDLIKEKIGDKEFIQKIKLNEESIKVINLILGSNTTIFNDLSKHIKDVISDKVIDINDIPSIILIIKDIVNINTKQINKLKLTREQVITFIKNVLFILIESETIKVKDKQTVEQLIDLSVQLLSTKINVQRVVRCFRF